jgi:hypothetical protein
MFDKIGLILALLSLLIGHYYYTKTFREKKVTFLVETKSILRCNMHGTSELEILCNGFNITGLSISNVIFWNSGTDLLHMVDDIVKGSPLQIRCSRDNLIIHASVSDDINQPGCLNLKLDEDRSTASLGFEYLDHLQSFTFQLVHTGSTSNDLEFLGKVKGGKIIVLRNDYNRSAVLRRISDFSVATLSFVCVFLIFRIKSDTSGLIAGILVSLLLMALSPLIVSFLQRAVIGLPRSYRNTD